MAAAFRSVSRLVTSAVTKNARNTLCGSRPVSPIVLAAYLPAHVAVTLNSRLRSRSITTTPLTLGHGTSDDGLARQLENELKYEKEQAETYKEEERPLTEFLLKNNWEVDSKPGSGEICLTKEFNGEKIHVRCSIKDVWNDENHTADSEGAVAAHAESEDGEEGEAEIQHGIAAQTLVTVEKPGLGALNFDCLIREGECTTTSVAHYTNPKLAMANDSQSDWVRRGLYGGPIFQQLDDDLQDAFTAYLEERGITGKFTVFLPRFIQVREQQEYANWLDRTKQYVKD